MKFLKVKLNNFGPYKGEHCVVFPTDRQRRVMVVYGDNMRGKTSFLNALRWVLYGKALDRQSKELDITKLVNFDAQSESNFYMTVQLTFEADGDVYELARSLEPRELVSTPKSKKDYSCNLLLRKNGGLVSGDLIERHINQFIPEQIARFYLFDAELLQEYESLLIENSEQGRHIKEAIEKILGVPSLINGRNEARELLRKAQILQAKEFKHVAALESQSSQSLQLQEEIEAHGRDLEGMRQRVEDFNSRVEAINDELSRTKSVQEAHSRMEHLQQEMRAIQSHQVELQRERLEILKGAWKDLLQPRLQARREEIAKRVSEHQGRIMNRGALEHKIKELQKLVAKNKCPTCGAPIDETRRADFGSQIGELLAEASENQANVDAIGTLTQELKDLNKLAGSGAAAALRRVERHARQNLILLTQYETEVENLKEQLRGHDSARVSQLQKEKEGLIRLRGKVEGDVERIEEEIEDKKAKVRQLSVLMSRNPEARKQRSSREVEIYSGLEQIFSRSIDVLRDRLRCKVADAATQAFRDLTTEETYTGLRINENYGLTILDRNHSDVPVRSAGAEQIVAMSLLSALNRTANRPGPVVIDTPFGRLDPRHRINIMKFVPQMAEQVVFLVHEGEVNRADGLTPILSHVGAVYEIRRVTSSQSVIVKV